MDFRVEPAALESFTKLLERYNEDIGTLRQYFGSPNLGADNSGLMELCTDVHYDSWNRAWERSSALGFLAINSIKDVRRAIQFYEKTDAEHAAKLDSTYPVPVAPDTHQSLPESTNPDAARVFRDVAGPNQFLQSYPDGGDLAPKAATIVKGVTQVGEYVSIMHWVRQLLQKICGFDPIEEFLQFFTGDWEAWARVAVIWKQCGKAMDAMAENIRYSDEALAEVWEGNAAESARAYFQQLTWATHCEARFFDYLYALYKEILDIAYYAYEKASDILNFLLDMLATLGFGAIVKGLARTPALIKKIYQCVDTIINIMSGAKGAVYETGLGTSVARAINLQEPPCVAETMETSTTYQGPVEVMSLDNSNW